MRSEIGSEFWDIPVAGKNHLFPEETKWFVSGRSGLRAILAENSFTTASLPAWCCDSMIQPFIDAGIKVSFYEDKPDCADVTLVMDYFGYATDNDYSDYPGTVIRDLTHSLFSKEYHDADYYFGSLRKWAGFRTGGYAWGFTKTVVYTETRNEYVRMREQAMMLKAEYIYSRSESKAYLAIFEAAEEELEKTGIQSADPKDIEDALRLDFYLIRQRRRENAKILLDAFSSLAIFPKMGDEDCPMFVPIRVKQRDALRRYLIQHEVYCPVHWPMSKWHCLSDEGKKLYMEELSLVCDQRYSEAEMNRTVRLIREFYAEGEESGAYSL